MNAQTHPAPQKDSLSRVLKKIREIAEKSENGDYIYRGEPECYPKVSSTLYRVFGNLFTNITDFNKEVVPDMLREAKEYTDETDEDEIQHGLQHYGGKTNLTDFTTDFFIALFFACDGSPDEDGRVILKDKTGDLDKNGRIILKDETGNITAWVKAPRNPQNRVLAQKSIFVSPFQGFIEPDDIIYIPKSLKPEMRDYLKKYHNISAGTIYNDLHGFIKRSAYTEFCNGLTAQNKREHAEAVKHYTEAVLLDPGYARAYVNRGIAYYDLKKYKDAIKDYRKAIELKPTFALAHYNLGNCYREKGDYDKAIDAYNKAIKLGLCAADTADAHNNCGTAYYRKGIAYRKKDKRTQAIEAYNKAIEAYNKAIELKPDWAMPYCNRGEAWLHMEEWKEAKSDMITAKKKGVDIIASFQNVYKSVADFEQQMGFQLPKDIAKMLTQR